MTSTQIDITTKSPNQPMQFLQKSFFFLNQIWIDGENIKKRYLC